MLSVAFKLQPQDWNSGDRTYVMDVITPISSKEFLKCLQEQKFEDKNVRMLKPRNDGKGFESVFLEELLK